MSYTGFLSECLSQGVLRRGGAAERQKVADAIKSRGGTSASKAQSTSSSHVALVAWLLQELALTGYKEQTHLFGKEYGLTCKTLKCMSPVIPLNTTQKNNFRIMTWKHTCSEPFC